MAGQSGKRMENVRSSGGNGSSPAVSFRSEVILWGMLAFSIILFISNFGIAGKVGNFISGIFFGLFGLVAYIFPVLLFAGTAFVISNKNNAMAVIKAVSAVVLTVFVCFFLELVGGDAMMKTPLDAYVWASKHKYGGGLTGGILAWLIRPNLGTVSAFVIDIAVMIICLVLITQRSFWKPIQNGGRRMYTSAKNETMRQRKNYEERKKRRMDNKFVGVSTDTTIKEPVKPANSDAVNELHPESFIAQKFPIQINGQLDRLDQLDLAKMPVNAGMEIETRAVVNESPGFVSGNRGPAGGADSVNNMIDFPINGMYDKRQKEQQNSQDDLDIVPVESQKIELQPSLPEDDAPKEHDRPQKPQTPAQEADDILARTSDLFSELLPDLESTAGPGPQEAEALPDYDRRDGQEPAADTAATDGIVDTDEYGGIAGAMDTESYGGISGAADMEAYDGAADMYTYGSTAGAADAEAYGGTAGDTELYGAAEEFEEPQEVLRQLAEPIAKPKPAARTAGEKPVSGSRQEAAAAPDMPARRQPQGARNPAPGKAGQNGVEDVKIPVQPPVRREYIFPPFEMLKPGDPNKTGDSRQHLQDTALKLQQTLKNFGVNVTILNVSCGPSVTRYEIQPEMGVKVSKIVNLADDIKLNLAAADIRIEAPIPGKAAIGIEVPNKETVTVSFRDLLEADDFKNSKSPCSFAVGKDIAGKVIVTDICRMPHLLIAGATGSGKSVCINTIIMSILYKAKPDDVKLIMIDPKVVELSVYNGIPHLLLPVVTDPKKAAGALHWAVSEMMDRYQKFAGCGVRDIKGYNAKIRQISDIEDAAKPEKMPYIVIIVDELADLMMVAPGEVEDAICRLAQLARAAGIHLIIATQRPSVNVITGLIKANMPSRIAFSVTSGIDSRTILDMNGAEKLLGKGDMLFYPQGVQKPLRVQGAFISDGEISKVVGYLTERNGTPQYDPSVAEKVANSSAGGSAAADSGTSDERDAYFSDAAKLLMEKDKASVSMLQRYFKIGFNRAARIMDQLEEAGVVGPEEGTKPRKILMSPEEFAQYEEEY